MSDDWDRDRFGDLYLVPSRNGVSVPKGDRTTGTKMINMGELFRFDRIADPPMARVPLSHKELGRSRVEPGDLLFARRSLKLAGAGRCVLVVEGAEDRVFESSIIRVRLDPARACSAFYYYLFRSREGAALISTIVEQVAVAGIRGSDLATLSVPVPGISEQQAIAEVLAALDAKIESNHRRADNAEALLDVLASAYGGLDPAPLGDLVEVDRVACTPGSQGDVLVDLFSLPAFDAGRLPDRTAGTTIKSGKLLVNKESVLVSRLNPSTNRTWFAVPDPLTLAAASTEFLVLRPRAELGIGALWLAVRDEYFRAELGRRATGTSGSHQRLRPDDALAIDVPDVRGLQPAAAAEADGLLRLVHHSRIESRTIAELRDALLPELLSGRLRVPMAEELVEAAT